MYKWNSRKLKRAYTDMQEACGIEVGDMVKVLGAALGYQMGWGTCWVTEMDEAIGKTYEVVGMACTPECGLELDIDGTTYYFPCFVLKVVTKRQDKKPKETTIKVTYRDEDGEDITGRVSRETKIALASK